MPIVVVLPVPFTPTAMITVGCGRMSMRCVPHAGGLREQPDQPLAQRLRHRRARPSSPPPRACPRSRRSCARRRRRGSAPPPVVPTPRRRACRTASPGSRRRAPRGSSRGSRAGVGTALAGARRAQRTPASRTGASVMNSSLQSRAADQGSRPSQGSGDLGDRHGRQDEISARIAVPAVLRRRLAGATAVRAPWRRRLRPSTPHTASRRPPSCAFDG